MRFLVKNLPGILRLSMWPIYYSPEGSASLKHFIKKNPAVSVAGLLFIVTVLRLSVAILAEGIRKLSDNPSVLFFCILLSAALAVLCVCVIIDPVRLSQNIRYEKSTWYKNTGLLPGEIDRGRMGEYIATLSAEKMLKKNGVEGKIYNYIYVPKPDGDYAEIDAAVVSPFGIDVLEAKARGGLITGTYTGDTWYQQTGNDMQTLENPIIQNLGHENALAYYLKDFLRSRHPEVPISSGQIFEKMTNVVLFTIPARWSITGAEPNLRICFGTAKQYSEYERSHVILSEKEIGLLDECLSKLCIADKEKREEKLGRILEKREGRAFEKPAYLYVKDPVPAVLKELGNRRTCYDPKDGLFKAADICDIDVKVITRYNDLSAAVARLKAT